MKPNNGTQQPYKYQPKQEPPIGLHQESHTIDLSVDTDRTTTTSTSKSTTARIFDSNDKLRHYLRSSIAQTTLTNGFLIITWYILSTCLSLWNKILLAKDRGLFGKGAFPAPFLMSSMQFFCQHLLARFLVWSQCSQLQAQKLSWKEYFQKVVPNGIATGLDIGFSNYSLVFISLSFYVMCKSTTPIFLLCFSFAWGIERPSWSLAGIVAVIVGGLLLLVAGETQFVLVGFLLVMTAAMLAGLRWTITQVLLQGGTLGDNNNSNSSGHGGGRSPVEAIYQLTPIMGISLLVLSLGHEKLWDTLPTSPYFETLSHALLTGVIMLVGGLIAFLMVWSEFALIANTSALTFMVAGTFKEILTVGAAVFFLHEDFTFVNALGLLVLIFGVVLFNMYKLKKIKEGKMRVTTIRGGNIGDADDDDNGLDNVGGGGVFSEQTSLLPQTMTISNSNTMTGGGGGGGGGGAMHPPLPPTPTSSASDVELSLLNGGGREGTTMISPREMDTVFVLSNGEEDGDDRPATISKIGGGANARHRVTNGG
jgi:solute carrier family 35, member C2